MTGPPKFCLLGLLGVLLLVSGFTKIESNSTAANAFQRQTLSLVDVSASSLGYSIQFAPPRDGLRAMTDTGNRRITIFASQYDDDVRVAHDVAHEIGHAFDDRKLTARSRDRYLELRGAVGTNWLPAGGDDASDYASGAGDFAEVFAACHSPSLEFRSTVALRPADPCGLVAATLAG